VVDLRHKIYGSSGLEAIIKPDAQTTSTVFLQVDFDNLTK